MPGWSGVFCGPSSGSPELRTHRGQQHVSSGARLENQSVVTTNETRSSSAPTVFASPFASPFARSNTNSRHARSTDKGRARMLLLRYSPCLSARAGPVACAATTMPTAHATCMKARGVVKTAWEHTACICFTACFLPQMRWEGWIALLLPTRTWLAAAANPQPWLRRFLCYGHEWAVQHGLGLKNGLRMDVQLHSNIV